jgi:hypothetical protein
MLFEKSKSVILIGENTIELAGGNGAQSLSIPPEVLIHLDIINPIAYNELISSFFDQIKLKENAIGIILKNEIIYFKKSTKQYFPTLIDAVNNFKRYIPHENAVARGIESNGEYYIYGTNKDLYSKVESKLKEVQNSVIMVVPETIVESEVQGIKSNQSEAANIFVNKMAQDMNFLI